MARFFLNPLKKQDRQLAAPSDPGQWLSDEEQKDFLTKYAAALLFVALQVLVFSLASFLVFGL
ncbi:MAG: hypothetical protein HGB14_06535, partial [Anaerolineaceae bacterium]|nr:hypothetical protein [Anaerolineaceae bacterium]